MSFMFLALLMLKAPTIIFAGNSTTDDDSKYIMASTFTLGRTADNAETFCQDTFGTQLASVHSVEDQEEASSTCIGRCWIGLKYNVNGNEWQWSDGTEYNADLRLWFGGAPTPTYQQCVYLNNFNPKFYGLWLLSDCDAQLKFICNRYPSNNDAMETTKIETTISSTNVYTTWTNILTTWTNITTPDDDNNDDDVKETLNDTDDSMIWIILCIIMFVCIALHVHLPICCSLFDS